MKILARLLLVTLFIGEFYTKTSNSLSVRGQLTGTAVGSHQKKKFNKDNGRLLLMMGSISFDGFLYNLKTRNKYAAVVDLSADMSTTKQQNPALNSAYISASGKWGEIKIGNAFSAATELAIDGTQLLGGDSGFAGTSLYSTFNQSAYSTIMVGCYYDPGFGTQVTYMSPIYKGFQVGITYVPNSLHVGLLQENDSFNSMSWGMETRPVDMGIGAIKTKDIFAYGQGGFTTDVFAGGLRYDWGQPHKFNGSFALVGWVGKANPEKKTVEKLKMKRLTAFSVGATFGYKHIKAGFGYVNQLKSCLPVERSNVTKQQLDAISTANWDRLANGADGAIEVQDEVPQFATGTVEGERGRNLVEDNGFGKGADAGQIFTAVLSYLPGINTKISLGGIYTVRKMASNEKTKAYGGSLIFDYKVMRGIGLFAGFTYMKTKTCRRAVLIAMSEAKASAAFANNNIAFISAGIKMNF